MPTSTPSNTGWSKLELPALAQVASLQATKAGPASVAPTTAFRLTSLVGSPVRELAGRLTVDPALDLRVTRVDGDTAVLRPTAPLHSGQIYRFELRRGDGTAEAAWAVQAAWPLQVATSLPGDQTTGVRRTTGIEITFDQAGVSLAEFKTHFSISPRVAGRFEQHGLTFVLVPTDPLKARTLYTVTIRHGLQLAETGMALEADEVIRFETAGGSVSRVHISMDRPLFDSATRERPAIGITLDSVDEEAATDQVKRVAVMVNRLPGLTAALDAYRKVAAAPDWTARSSTTPVRTSSLPQVLQASVTVERTEYGNAWFRLPRALGAGWYVVTMTHAGISRQAVLQVSDLATFSLASLTRSLVWVNDLRSNDPVAGARVELAGTPLGTTDDQGLVVGPSPAALQGDAGDGTDEGAAALVVVRAGSRTAFLPLASDECGRACGWDGRDTWWQLLTLDRGRYRPTDTIHAWGVVRNRATRDVPTTVTVRLQAYDDDPSAPIAVASDTVRPDASGSFLGDLSFRDVPPGDYLVSVLVGQDVIGSTWLSIAPIVKPAWRVDLAASRHAVVSGSSVEVTAAASFFEGTPVAGATLTYATDSDDDGTSRAGILATTDSDGAATATVPLRFGSDHGSSSTIYVYAGANEPEEADISGSIPVIVFASTAYLDAEGKLAGQRLTVTGALHSVAFDRYEQPGVDLWSVDPRGAPRAGASVQIHVTEIIPVVTRTGTRYDFIAKESVPVYSVDERRKDLGTRTVVTGPDGTFRISRTVTGGDRSYDVDVAYTDEGGRRVTVDTSAWSEVSYYDTEPNVISSSGRESYGTYRVGDKVSVTFTNGIKDPEVERYLYATLSRGLRSVSVQRSARFSTRFSERLLPNARITGVRFTGTGYEVSRYGFSAALQTDDRALQIRLSADRARYAPGGRATVAIQTLDAAGQPVAASVFIRAVDEKLFAMNAAWADDPLSELYQETGSGVIGLAWSHRPPSSEYSDGKGDTTGGGGERADFRDVLLSRLVTTGADGRATTSFDISDDLTSWRMLASGVTSSLLAGNAMLTLPVGLPMFAEAVVAPEYLAADRPVIRLRAYGSALQAGDPVTFQVSSDSLPMASMTVAGTAFKAVEVALPRLAVGTHRLRIQASAGTGSELRSDALIRTFEVVRTRTVRVHVASVPLAAGTTVDGADGLTRVTLVDSGRGRVVPLLRELARAEPVRADAALAAAIARGVLVDAFDIPDDPGLSEPEIAVYQSNDGIALLPYASADLELSAMAAFSGDPRISREKLRWYFDDTAGESEDGLPTDRAMFLLLGRASISEATMSDVTAAAARTDLTAPQRTTVALAALALGDEALARSIYLDLLGKHGERLGPWVRVHVGDAEQTAVTTARLAIVAASLGDPIAADMDAELVAHPPADTLVDLERAIAARYWADRMPVTDAAAAVTIDGRPSVMAIAAGEPVVFEVTPAQRAGLRIDPVRGSVLVVSEWDGNLQPGDLAPPDGQRVTRTVTPSGPIGSTDTVVVTFTVRLGTTDAPGCWNLTDFVPSGLAPVSSSGRWEDADDEVDAETAGIVEQPWRVIGQRVDFCVERNPRRAVHTLRYLARVVTPGSYRWESAVLQSSMIPEQGTVLPGFNVTIAGLGS